MAGGWKEGREERRTPWGRAGEAVGYGGQLVPDGVRLQLLLLRRRRRHLRSSVVRLFAVVLVASSPSSLPLSLSLSLSALFSWDGKGTGSEQSELPEECEESASCRGTPPGGDARFEAAGGAVRPASWLVGGGGAGTRQRTNGRGTDDSAVTHVRSGCHCHAHPTAPPAAEAGAGAEAEQ